MWLRLTKALHLLRRRGCPTGASSGREGGRSARCGARRKPSPPRASPEAAGCARPGCGVAGARLVALEAAEDQTAQARDTKENQDRRHELDQRL
jgi:hypothetical protein